MFLNVTLLRVNHIYHYQKNYNIIVRVLLIPREARFIISSRAKRACITQASQGQRDFLLAINLSSLVGVRLDVIQGSDIKAHYGFRGNRLPSRTKLWVSFMKTGFFICELLVGESPPNISGK